MADVATSAPGRVVWIDLATKDPGGAEKFYGELLGWEREVNQDPQFGGYGFFKTAGRIAAGVGPLQSEQQPTVWQVYIGTADAEATAAKVQAAGGSVIAPPFDVGPIGKMAVFQDPSGAFVSIWQSSQMPGVEIQEAPNSLSWAELNARGLDKAKPFYKAVFGWDAKTSDSGGGMEYTEWQLGGKSVGGAMEMMPMVPAEVPSYWLVYFGTDDVDGTTAKAKELGGQVLLEPTDFPGGRSSVLMDPQGASFALVSIRSA